MLHRPVTITNSFTYSLTHSLTNSFHTMSHRTPSAEYYHNSRNNKLPPIKVHLRDVFEAPPRPGYVSDTSRSSRQQPPTSSRHYSASSAYDESDDHYHRSSHSSRAGSHGSQAHRTDLSNPPHPSRRVEAESPGHVFGLYRTTPSQLKHEGSSTRDVFPSRSARTTNDNSRPHICSECGSGFERPGTLEIHMRSHTGEKPFECPVEGCHKTFSVQSNMRRHERTHTRESAFEPVNEDGPTGTSRASQHSAYSYTSSFPAQYYSSSRRE